MLPSLKLSEPKLVECENCKQEFTHDRMRYLVTVTGQVNMITGDAIDVKIDPDSGRWICDDCNKAREVLDHVQGVQDFRAASFSEKQIENVAEQALSMLGKK